MALTGTVKVIAYRTETIDNGQGASTTTAITLQLQPGAQFSLPQLVGTGTFIMTVAGGLPAGVAIGGLFPMSFG